MVVVEYGRLSDHFNEIVDWHHSMRVTKKLVMVVVILVLVLVMLVMVMLVLVVARQLGLPRTSQG